MKKNRPNGAANNIKVIAIVCCFALILTLSIVGIVKLVASMTTPITTTPEATQPDNEQPDEFVNFGSENIPVVGEIEKSSYDPNLFKFENNRMHYTDPKVKTWAGIDVSAHREEIDWSAVNADGIDFAMLRVGWRGNTEGKIYLDEYFVENIKGASAAGLDIGVYFYSQAITVQEAIDEAKAVIGWIDDYEITYPVVFDWEYVSSDARTGSISNEMLNDCAVAFCQTIENAGYIPSIYFNLDIGYRRYDLAKIGNYDFWLAEYDGAPTFYYNYQMLQYTSNGIVKGSSDRVDLNISFVDYASLSKNKNN